MASYPSNYPQWAKDAASNCETTVPAFMDVNNAAFDPNWMNNPNPFGTPGSCGSSNVNVRLYGSSTVHPCTRPIGLAHQLQDNRSIICA